MPNIRKAGLCRFALAAVLAIPLWLPAAAGAQDPDAPTEEDAVQDEETPMTTGDEWVDLRLDDIGAYARRHRDPFVDELVRYRDAPRELVVDLLEQRDWEPGDVYFACSLARVIGRPCRFVADQYAQSLLEGWDALASALGAGAGSEEFARVKRGIVRSYERWARPLTLDAELAAAFPDHGKPSSARTADPGGGR